MMKLTERKTPANSTFAIGGVSCSAYNFVVTGSSGLRINICAKNPAHRKSAKRYQLYSSETTKFGLHKNIP